MPDGIVSKRKVVRSVETEEAVVLQVRGVWVEPGRVVVDLQDIPASVPVDRRELTGDTAAPVLKLWEQLSRAALKALSHAEVGKEEPGK